PSRNPREKRRRNEREGFDSRSREGSQDRVDREWTGDTGTPRRRRCDARGAPFRFGEYEVESRRKSFRRETVAAKGNRPRPCRLQIVADLAWWWCSFRAEAARLFQEGFQDN